MKKPSNRLTLQLQPIATREQAESIVGDIALITINKTRLTAAMDAELQAVKARHEAGISQCDVDLTSKTNLLSDWAQTNPDQFPKDRRSIKFLQGTIGFRKGNPKVVQTSRAWTAVKVLSAITLLRWRKFIRIQREVDKEAILARAAACKKPERFAERLARVGLKVVQDETFYVDPEVTEVTTRQTVEAA